MAILTGPKTIYSIDPRSNSSTKQAELGTKGIAPDGRIYRYIRAGASALDPGKVAVCPDVTANHTIDANTLAVSAIGATEITITPGATNVTANQYAEGWFVVQDGTGEGIAYKISGHPAITASTAGVITLAEPLKVALDATTEVDLIPSIYNGAVIAVTDQSDIAVGIPNVTLTGTYYGWAQTGGPCAVWFDEIVAAGHAVTFGTSVAGSVEMLDGAGEQQIGVVMNAPSVDTEYEAVFLTLDN